MGGRETKKNAGINGDPGKLNEVLSLLAIFMAKGVENWSMGQLGSFFKKIEMDKHLCT